MKKQMKKLSEANKIAMTKINLDNLTLAQLIALGRQKTDIPYSELVSMSREKLLTYLSEVERVLTPVQA